MGSVIGLLFGAGAFCLWWACWEPRAEKSATAGRGSRLQSDLAVLDRSWLQLTTVTAAGLLAAGLVFLVVLATAGSVSVASIFGLAAGLGPAWAVRVLAARRRQDLRRHWPDAVDHLSSGIRAGLALPEALAGLGSRGPEPLRPHFVRFAADYRSTGQFSPALDRLKDQMADPVTDRIVEALRLTRDVGGTDLGRLLRTLSSFLREDARARAELEARQSWTLNAARLAVTAPWLVLALLCTRPEAVTAYDSPAGAAVLGVGAVVCLVAYHAMVRLGRLPQEPRVLQ